LEYNFISFHKSNILKLIKKNQFMLISKKNLEYCVVFLAIIVSIELYPRFQQFDGLDANIYLGYINNYKELFHIYGLTYYSSRLAYIFPSIVFSKIFGIDNGVYLLNCLILFFYAFFLNRIVSYKNEATFIPISFLVFASSILIARTSWTCYEFIACFYLLAHVSYLLSDQKYKFQLSGFFAYLSVNCNMFFLALSGISFLLFYFLNKNKLNKIKYAKEIIYGFIFGFSFITLIHLILIDFEKVYFIERAQLDMSKELMSGLSKQWFVSFEKIFERQIFFLLPFIYIYFGLVYFTFEKIKNYSLVDKFSIFYLISMSSFGIFMHYAFDRPWFAYEYKTIYFYVPTSLVSAVIISKILFKKKIDYKILLSIIFLLYLTINFNDLSYKEIPLDYYKYFLLILMIIYPILFTLRKYSYYLIISLLVFTPSLLMFSMPKYHYTFNYFNRDISKINHEKMQCLVSFQNNVLKIVDSYDKTFKFLYISGVPYLSAIQSSFLWGYSKIQVDLNNDNEVIFDQEESILYNKADFIVILADKYEHFEILSNKLNSDNYIKKNDEFNCYAGNTSIHYQVYKKNK